MQMHNMVITAVYVLLALFILVSCHKYRRLMRIVIMLVLSAIYPVVIVGVSCLIRSESEDCVWGKAFLLFYIPVSLLFGPIILGLLTEKVRMMLERCGRLIRRIRRV